MSDADAPLLRVTAARIDAGGALLGVAGSLTFEVEGDRVALLGHFEPLWRLFTREARLVDGTVEILGQAADVALASGTVGLDLSDAELPTQGTPLDLYTSSLELSGDGVRGARRRARSRADLLGVGALLTRPMATLHRTERRAIAIAHAGLAQPAVVVLGNPLTGLDGTAAGAIVGLVERVAAGRKLVVGMESPSAVGAEATLVASMERVVLLGREGAITVGAPAEVLGGQGRYLIVATRNTGALERALVERGHAVERLSSPPIPLATQDLGRGTQADDGPGRLLVQVPEPGNTRLVVEWALAVDAPIVELLPLGGPPAP